MMKKSLLVLFVSLVLSFLYMPFDGPPSAAEDKYGIQDPDCDAASQALTSLTEEIRAGKMKPNEKAYIQEKLSENISGYQGDSEKCIMVNQDFVKALSIDALAEFADQKFKPVFQKHLFHISEFQSGDIRQHSAMALAKIKAVGVIPSLLKAIRDKNTFTVGYKGTDEELIRLTIEQKIALENRDLKKDPFSFPILEALKTLAAPKDFDLVRAAIEEEYEEYLKGRSNWNDPLRADMLRIAASLNGKETIPLVEKHRELAPIDKLRVYAYISTASAVPKLKELIVSTLKMEYPEIPEEAKLAFKLLDALKLKESRSALRELADSLDPSISFMANVYLAQKPESKSSKEIKSRILTSSDRLKIEGVKTLSDLKDRNAIPIIKSIMADENLKLKVYSIWALANLRVKDPLEDAMKLKQKITSHDEEAAKMNLIGSLDEAISIIQSTKAAYPASKAKKR